MFGYTICLGRGLPFEPVEWSADLSGMGAFEPSRHSQQAANGCVKQFFPANHRGLHEKDWFTRSLISPPNFKVGLWLGGAVDTPIGQLLSRYLPI